MEDEEPSADAAPAGAVEPAAPAGLDGTGAGFDGAAAPFEGMAPDDAAGGDGEEASPTTAAEAQRSRTPSEAERADVSCPPEEIQTWVRQEDWEALREAWADAESEARQWEDPAEAPGAGGAVEITSAGWAPGAADAASWPQQSQHQSQQSQRVSRKSGKRGPTRKPWNDNVAMTNDHRVPIAQRRYFDLLAAETSSPKPRGLPPLQREDSRNMTDTTSRTAWIDAWSQLASRDNAGIHPHLRHYFDRRGLEASFRQRPTCDSPWNRSIRPRTPQKPAPGEVLMRHSQSLPSMPAFAPRGEGGIRWGRRCLRYGTDRNPTLAGEDKVPWVEDHHLGESEDNVGLNPLLRHYFDADGLESSFRNRGRHYNRPMKSVFGITTGSVSTTSGSSPKSRTE